MTIKIDFTAGYIVLQLRLAAEPAICLGFYQSVDDYSLI